MSLRGRLLLAASWLACRLPEGPLFAFADFAGDLWYRLKPGRAAQARRNLRRVSCSLADAGLGSPAVRAAATDPKALERLVRSSFRHMARYYLEVARTPGLTKPVVEERLQLDTPELIAEAVVPGKAVLFVGLHFGSVELAVVFLAMRVGETVTPMETIDDPGLQAWFERTRGVVRGPAGRAPRGAPRADGGARERHPGGTRRRPRPDRRRDPDPALRCPGEPAAWVRRCSRSRVACRSTR